MHRESLNFRQVEPHTVGTMFGLTLWIFTFWARSPARGGLIHCSRPAWCSLWHTIFRAPSHYSSWHTVLARARHACALEGAAILIGEEEAIQFCLRHTQPSSQPPFVSSGQPSSPSARVVHTLSPARAQLYRDSPLPADNLDLE